MRFSPDFLRALDELRLVSTRALAGAGLGDRRGRQRGQGVEFADYRPYAQGDDFRHVDWKAYRRLNRLLLRLFDEDQDLRVYVFLDASASMAVHGKFDHAARLAAALCCIGLARLDRVALLPFQDGLAPGASAARRLPDAGRALELLDALAPAGQTNLWQAVLDFSDRPAPAGLAILISDFLDPAGAARPIARLAAAGHEVAAVHVMAAADRALIDADVVLDLVDAETGDHRRVTVTPGLAAAHARAWAAADAELAAACAKTRAAYLQADVDVPVERTVLETFRRAGLVQ